MTGRRQRGVKVIGLIRYATLMSSGPPRDIGGFPWVYFGVTAVDRHARCRDLSTPRCYFLSFFVSRSSCGSCLFLRGPGDQRSRLCLADSNEIASGIVALLILPRLLRLLVVLALRMTSGSLPALLEAVLSNSPTAHPPFGRR